MNSLTKCLRTWSSTCITEAVKREVREFYHHKSLLPCRIENTMTINQNQIITLPDGTLNEPVELKSMLPFIQFFRTFRSCRLQIHLTRVQLQTTGTAIFYVHGITSYCFWNFFFTTRPFFASLSYIIFV